MDTRAEVQNGASNLSWIFSTALVGAFGVGMQFARTICDYRHSNEQAPGHWDWHGDIILGVVFLATVVVNSAVCFHGCVTRRNLRRASTYVSDFGVTRT
jgi:hypothetical protein